MADPQNPPKNECRQCWAHAHDKTIHRALPRELDHCPQCVQHMINGHGDMIVK